MCSFVNTRKIETISLGNFNCEIELSGNYSQILTNFDTIKGKVHFYLHHSTPKGTLLLFKSLRIQLEGIVTILDTSNSCQKQEQLFLPLEAAKDSPFLSSLCFHFIRGGKPTRPQFHLPHGHRGHSYPFEIFLTGQNLPATFKSDCGKIKYRLVVYGSLHLSEPDVECILTQKILTSKGCLNLSRNPHLSHPWIVTRRQKKNKSIFNKKQNCLKAHLVLEKRGFLPGDTLNWHLNVENPMCENIGKLSTTLVQKIIYFTDRGRKVTLSVLGKEEFNCELTDGEIHWECGLPLARNLIPSFTRKLCLEIIYLIEFAVQLVGNVKPVGLTGETIIVIGTMRDGDDRHFGAVAGSSRSLMEDDDGDNISIQTFSTLPPSYSNLTSRQPSLETLPPAYSDIMEMEGEGEEGDESEFIL